MFSLLVRRREEDEWQRAFFCLNGKKVLYTRELCEDGLHRLTVTRDTQVHCLPLAGEMEIHFPKDETDTDDEDYALSRSVFLKVPILARQDGEIIRLATLLRKEILKCSEETGQDDSTVTSSSSSSFSSTENPTTCDLEELEAWKVTRAGFAESVQQLSQPHPVTGSLAFDRVYALLEELSRQIFRGCDFEAALNPMNRPRNRYTNILPGDSYRVHLEVPEKEEDEAKAKAAEAKAEAEAEAEAKANAEAEAAARGRGKEEEEKEGDTKQQQQQQPKQHRQRLSSISKSSSTGSLLSLALLKKARDKKRRSSTSFSSIHSDYINASFIDGMGPGSQRAYVAAQGPLVNTIEDFWQMIWNLDSHVVVMLCNLTEGGRSKCAQYWPDEGDGMDLVEYTISCAKEVVDEDNEDLLVRELELKRRKTGEARVVRHIQYTGWPDQGVPIDHSSFVKLLQLVDEATEEGRRRRKRRRRRKEDGGGGACGESGAAVDADDSDEDGGGGDGENEAPVVVHCSAGVGRTGTFCTVHSAKRKLERARKEGHADTCCFNICKYLLQMRQQRFGMIQTRDQFKFCFKALVKVLGSDEERESEEESAAKV